MERGESGEVGKLGVGKGHLLKDQVERSLLIMGDGLLVTQISALITVNTILQH